MFSGVRRHINATTIVAVFALVFAMTGGAFAVTSKGGSPDKAVVAKSKAKTKTVRGPAGPRGAMGPAGAQGTQGAAGAQGTAGPQGAKGETGATGASGPKGETGASGKNGSPGEPGEQGPPGTTGFTKTLPSEETETGTWVAGARQAEETQLWFVPVSFSIPLKAGLGFNEVHYIKTGETSKECPGSVGIPKAAPGQFCLYQGRTDIPEEEGATTGEPGEVEVFIYDPSHSELSSGTSTAGSALHVLYKGPAPPNASVEVSGTWAVTAPKEL